MTEEELLMKNLGVKNEEPVTKDTGPIKKYFVVVGNNAKVTHQMKDFGELNEAKKIIRKAQEENPEGVLFVYEKELVPISKMSFIGDVKQLVTKSARRLSLNEVISLLKEDAK